MALERVGGGYEDEKETESEGVLRLRSSNKLGLLYRCGTLGNIQILTKHIINIYLLRQNNNIRINDKEFRVKALKKLTYILLSIVEFTELFLLFYFNPMFLVFQYFIYFYTRYL